MFSFMLSSEIFSQVENVPVNNPVYDYLKRMEIKGIVERYPNLILPLSRREVAKFVEQIDRRRSDLTPAERGILEDLKVEFAHELGLGDGQRFGLFSGERLRGGSSELASEKEKFFYVWVDSSNSFFMDGLFQIDYLKGTGDLYGGNYAGVFSLGPRFRGTLMDRFGYYLQVTHSEFTGNKDFALSRPEFPRNRHLKVGFRDFDLTEGYLRYDAGAFQLQVGRERMLWGTGRSDRLILSGFAPVFDYFRVNAQYRALSFMFFHSWLLGPERLALNTYSGKLDSFLDPKYLAGRRVELSFPNLFDIGISDLIVYSRRSPELAYLNPVNFFKAIEPEFHNRDNSLVALDLEFHAIENFEIYATLLIDDIQIDKIGSDYFGNKFAYNMGVGYIEALGIRDFDVSVEYTKIDPYVYTHDILENNFTNDGVNLGHRVGPNSDGLFFRADYRFNRKWTTSLEFERTRHGENIFDGGGRLLKNVGGNILYGHRSFDSVDVPFLDGILTKSFYFRVKILYEIFNELFLDLRYEYRHQKNVSFGKTSKDHFLFLQLRLDL